MKNLGHFIFALIAVVVLAQNSFGETSNSSFDSVSPDLTMSPKIKSDEPQYLSQVYGGWSGHISYSIGYQKNDSGDWGSASDRFQYGAVDIDFRPPDFGINFVAQVLTSYSDSAPPQPNSQGNWSQTEEINLGVRKLFENDSQFVPFVGGGVSIVGAQTRTTIANTTYQRDNQWGVGLWGGVGCYWHINESFHIGGALQYTWADMDLTGQGDINGGGLHLMFLIGGHW